MPPPAIADGAGLTYLRQRLNRHLQVLGWPEGDFLARFDLDGFSGRRVSPHAGGALPDLQDAKSRNPDPLAFLEMLGDQAYEIAEDRLALAFREFMIGRQPCRQMLERNGTAGLGTHWCHRFARHDGLPSSEARNAHTLGDMIRDRKESDLCALSGQNTALFAFAPDAGLVLCAVHVGGTFRNRSGNEAESQQERRSFPEGVPAPASATGSAVRGLRALADSR